MSSGLRRRLKPAAGLMLAAWVGMSSASAAVDPAMVRAARVQDAAQMRALLRTRVDVNAADVEGLTALHWAAHWNDATTVRALLAAGARPNTASRYGVTPLLEATVASDISVVQALLSAGADPNVALPEGETPLMRAARTGNVAVVEMLIKKGANVTARESFRGADALIFAVAEDQEPVVRLLLARGASANSRMAAYDNKHQAVRGGSIAYFYINGGLTALHLAARQGAVESGRVLMEAGADAAVVDPDLQMTPLHVAIYNGNYAFAAMLAERGANVDGALYLVEDMRNLNRSSKRAMPSTAGTLELMKVLLSHGADPNGELTVRLPPRENGNPAQPPRQSALYRAARSTDIQGLRLLLDAGAKPDAGSSADGSTPLMALLAGGGGRGGGGNQAPAAEAVNDAPTLEAIDLLLAKGANVNAVNNVGDSALHAAAQRGRNALVERLARGGATLDLKNKQGLTPLDFAEGKARPAAARGGGGGEPAAPPPSFPETAALLKRLADPASRQ